MVMIVDSAIRMVTAAGCRSSVVGCRKSRIASSISCLLAVSLFAPTIFAEEIDVARKALRDGLWDVARNHAALAGEDSVESRAVIAESFAREGKWSDLLAALEKWNNPKDDIFVYYRALALFEIGKSDQAAFLIRNRSFNDAVYAKLIKRLKARITLADSGAVDALKIVKESEGVATDEDSEMFAASLMAATGDRSGAEEIWRSVVSRGTNSSEKAFAAASVGLGDEKFLREAYERSSSADTRRLSGYALARLLLSKEASVDEGAALVRSLVREAPDANGAREGMTAVADAYLRYGRYEESVSAYRKTFNTWPKAIKAYALHDGLGWALLKLGKYNEAIEEFAQAETTAANDAERAMAVVKQGDVLVTAGKVDDAFLKYREVLEKYPATESASRIKDLVRLRDLEDQGRDFYREYRFADAQEVFIELAERDPARKPRMDFFVVLCLYGQGLDGEAERRAREIAQDCTDSDVKSAATLWLAKHSYNKGDWAQARSLFVQFSKIAPNSPDAPDALVWSARAAFAESDFNDAIQLVTTLDSVYPNSPARVRGFLVQGEALIELARFDEAVLVLERVALAQEASSSERLRARLLGADALFAMGADNPIRYQEALEAYRNVKMGETLDLSEGLVVSYKIARTLEKLKRVDEAIESYYVDVVLAYRKGRSRGVRFDDEAKASFSRAAFRLADGFESRGRDYQAVHILELVSTSDVPAGAEARKRIERIKRKGKFL